MTVTSVSTRPMIGSWEERGAGGRGTIVVDPTNDSILYDHIYKDTPLLPAAAILESFAEALEFAGAADGPVVLEEIQFLNGVRFFTAAPQTLHVDLTPTATGWDVQLTQEFRNRHGALLDPARLCCKATIRFRAPAFDDWGWMPPPPGRWQQTVYSERRSNWMGPSLHGLQQVNLERDEGWGEIVAPVETTWRLGSTGEWRFSPGVLDGALVACSMWVQTNRPGSLQLPMTMRRIWLGKNPPVGSRLRESFHVQELSENMAVYDLRVWDETGQMILKIDDYHCSLVREPGVLTITLRDPQ